MGSITRTITTDDGRTIEPDSVETYEILAETLGKVDTILQDEAEVVVPGLFREDLHKARSALMEIRGESGEIANHARGLLKHYPMMSKADVLDRALAEHRWRVANKPRRRRSR